MNTKSVKNSKSFKSSLLIITILGLFIFGGMGITKLTGLWRTESSKIPSVFTDGEFAGKYDPADIRGSYTFSNINDSFGISPEILASAFSLNTEEPGEIKVKDIEGVWGDIVEDADIGTGSVRLFTALWCSLPYTPDDRTILPLKAVQILLENGKITGETAEKLEKHAVELPKILNDEEITQKIESSEEDTEYKVKGFTTFGELKKWGITEENWKELTGLPMGPSLQSIKGWADENGISISEFRNSLQDLVDLNNEKEK